MSALSNARAHAEAPWLQPRWAIFPEEKTDNVRGCACDGGTRFSCVFSAGSAAIRVIFLH